MFACFIVVCAVIPDGKSEDASVAPRRVDQLNCNAIDCSEPPRNSVVPDCPADSRPVPIHLTGMDADAGDGGLCCNGQTSTRLSCQCLPCDDRRQTPGLCESASQVRVVVQEGLGTPGQCCDVYQCVNQCE